MPVCNQDTDNNGVFEPSVDQFVSSYDFLVPSYANEPLWGPMTNVAQERPDGTVEYVQCCPRVPLAHSTPFLTPSMFPWQVHAERDDAGQCRVHRVHYQQRGTRRSPRLFLIFVSAVLVRTSCSSC